MRKEQDYVITTPGRDQGKRFHLKEMPASRAEKWAMKALLAVARSGTDIPDDFATMGMQGIAILGIRALAKIQFEEAEPLLDEMMSCVTVKPDPNNLNIERPLMVDVDIEEISTLIELRSEVIGMHVGFSLAGGPLTSPLSQSSSASTSSNTRTSPAPSDKSSRRARSR